MNAIYVFGEVDEHSGYVGLILAHIDGGRTWIGGKEEGRERNERGTRDERDKRDGRDDRGRREVREEGEG